VKQNKAGERSVTSEGGTAARGYVSDTPQDRSGREGQVAFVRIREEHHSFTLGDEKGRGFLDAKRYSQDQERH